MAITRTTIVAAALAAAVSLALGPATASATAAPSHAPSRLVHGVAGHPGYVVTAITDSDGGGTVVLATAPAEVSTTRGADGSVRGEVAVAPRISAAPDPNLSDYESLRLMGATPEDLARAGITP